MNFLVVQILYFLLLVGVDASLTCHSVVVANDGTGMVRCSNWSPNVRELTWQLQQDGNHSFTTVANCSISSHTCWSLSEHFQVSVNYTHSFLTFGPAHQNISQVRCVADQGGEAVNCSLEFYYRLKKPSCRAAEAHGNGLVVISCQARSFGRQFTCIFISDFPARSTQIVQPSSQNKPISAANLASAATSQTSLGASMSSLVPHSAQVDQSWPEVGSCRESFNVTGLGPGQHKLQVVMRPAAVVFPQDRISLRQEIWLRAPSLEIAGDCLQGPEVNLSSVYLDLNNNTNCSCQLRDEGFPPGRPQWYTLDGSRVGSLDPSNNRTSTITLAVAVSDQNQSYECGATTPLHASINRIFFKPQIAYGPYNVTTETSGSNVSSCADVIITCVVLVVNVKPGVTFSIMINSKPVVHRQPGNQNTSVRYSFIYTHRPTTSGKTVVTCRAENSVLSYRKTSSLTVINVKGGCSAASSSWNSLDTIELIAGIGGFLLILTVVIATTICVVLRRRRHQTASTELPSSCPATYIVPESGHSGTLPIYLAPGMTDPSETPLPEGHSQHYQGINSTAYTEPIPSRERHRHQPAGFRDRQQPAGSRDRQQPAGSRERHQPAGSRERHQPAGSRERHQPAGSRERHQPAGSRDPSSSELRPYGNFQFLDTRQADSSADDDFYEQEFAD